MHYLTRPLLELTSVHVQAEQWRRGKEAAGAAPTSPQVTVGTMSMTRARPGQRLVPLPELQFVGGGGAA